MCSYIHKKIERYYIIYEGCGVRVYYTNESKSVSACRVSYGYENSASREPNTWTVFPVFGRRHTVICIAFIYIYLVHAIDRKIRVSRDCIIVRRIDTFTVLLSPSIQLWGWTKLQIAFLTNAVAVVGIIRSCYVYNIIMRRICVRLKMWFTVADRLLRQTRRGAWCINCRCCRF